MRTCIVILCGGRGTRIKPLLIDRPKNLLLCHGKTFLRWQIEHFLSFEFTSFILCVHHGSSLIAAEVESIKSQLDVSITLCEDGANDLGTGKAILNTLPLVSENFMVTNGDSFLPINPVKLEERMLVSDDCIMSVAEPKFPSSANVRVRNKKILKYSKKHQAGLNLIDYGLLGLKRSRLLALSDKKIQDAGDIYRDLIETNSLTALEFHEPYFDIGSYIGYSEFLNFINRKT